MALFSPRREMPGPRGFGICECPPPASRARRRRPGCGRAIGAPPAVSPGSSGARPSAPSSQAPGRPLARVQLLDVGFRGALGYPGLGIALVESLKRDGWCVFPSPQLPRRDLTRFRDRAPRAAERSPFGSGSAARRPRNTNALGKRAIPFNLSMRAQDVFARPKRRRRHHEVAAFVVQKLGETGGLRGRCFYPPWDWLWRVRRPPPPPRSAEAESVKRHEAFDRRDSDRNSTGIGDSNVSTLAQCCCPVDFPFRCGAMNRWRCNEPRTPRSAACEEGEHLIIMTGFGRPCRGRLLERQRPRAGMDLLLRTWLDRSLRLPRKRSLRGIHRGATSSPDAREVAGAWRGPGGLRPVRPRWRPYRGGTAPIEYA